MTNSFLQEKLTAKDIEELQKLSTLARGDIITMTTLSQSGHPGGSMSSIDIYLTLWKFSNTDPKNPLKPDRDRIVVSHAHTSPGVYAALGRLGYFDIEDAVAFFRHQDSIFEGHIEREVPGVEWSGGNLGQGLSAACGFALAGRIKNIPYHVFTVMGDGEQQKGQISEARRLAYKYKLTNLTAIVDMNHLQISGDTHKVMPQNIKENFISDGWKVLEINAHNFNEIYSALKESINDKDNCIAIMAESVMSKGVSFMENKAEYHGKTLTIEQCREALKELKLPDNIDKYKKTRETKKSVSTPVNIPRDMPEIKAGQPRTYNTQEKTDNRSAYGNALTDIAENNKGNSTPIAVFDCDLASSVKTSGFSKILPDNFIQAGIQEHNTATAAAAVSSQKIITFFSDFGVFGFDETYNQHRLGDINHSNLKLVCTHNGLDVGEDGKTHQCIDYIGLMQNLFGYKIIIPADPNQTDRVIRYIAETKGNFAVTMGRSKMLPITTEDNKPLFGEKYRFEYGKIDIVREGNDGSIIATGAILINAIEAHNILSEKHNLKFKVLHMSCPSAPDIKAIKSASETGIIITLEDHHVKTGIGSIVANVLAENRLSPKLKKLGIKKYGKSGSPEDLYAEQGLDAKSILNTALSLVESK
jgi:transketolase